MANLRTAVDFPRIGKLTPSGAAGYGGRTPDMAAMAKIRGDASLSAVP
jgi:hypothetical protein